MIRRLLIGLLAFTALNALGGGIYGLLGAPDVPTRLLEGTPFTAWRLPGLILLVGVGGTQSAAAVGLFRRGSRGPALGALAGAILLIWIGIQVSLIGYVSALQPVMAGVALAEIGLATYLARRRRS